MGCLFVQTKEDDFTILSQRKETLLQRTDLPSLPHPDHQAMNTTKKQAKQEDPVKINWFNTYTKQPKLKNMLKPNQAWSTLLSGKKDRTVSNLKAT